MIVKFNRVGSGLSAPIYLDSPPMHENSVLIHRLRVRINLFEAEQVWVTFGVKVTSTQITPETEPIPAPLEYFDDPESGEIYAEYVTTIPNRILSTQNSMAASIGILSPNSNGGMRQVTSGIIDIPVLPSLQGVDFEPIEENNAMQILGQVNQNTTRLNELGPRNTVQNIGPRVVGAENAIANMQPRLEQAEGDIADLQPRMAGAENDIASIKPRLSDVEGLAGGTAGTLTSHLTDINAHPDVQAAVLQAANDYTDQALANAEQPARYMDVLAVTSALPLAITYIAGGGRNGDWFKIIVTDDIGGRADIVPKGTYALGMPATATFSEASNQWHVLVSLQNEPDGDTIALRDPDGALQVIKLPNKLTIKDAGVTAVEFDGSESLTADIAQDAVRNPDGTIGTLEAINYSDLMAMSDLEAAGREFSTFNDPADELELEGGATLEIDTTSLIISNPTTESLDGAGSTQSVVNQQLVYSSNSQQNKLAEHEERLDNLTVNKLLSDIDGVVTGGTSADFLVSLESKVSAGDRLVGFVEFTDLPFSGNAEIAIDILDDNLFYVAQLTSTDTPPYSWMATGFFPNSMEWRGGGGGGADDTSQLAVNTPITESPSGTAETQSVVNVQLTAGLALAPTTSQMNNALALKISTSEKGTPSGVATLDEQGKVPTSQLPATTGLDTSQIAIKTPLIESPTGDEDTQEGVNIAVTDSILAIEQKLDGKQDSLSAGDGIAINDNVISATAKECDCKVKVSTGNFFGSTVEVVHTGDNLDIVRFLELLAAIQGALTSTATVIHSPLGLTVSELSELVGIHVAGGINIVSMSDTLVGSTLSSFAWSEDLVEYAFIIVRPMWSPTKESTTAKIRLYAQDNSTWIDVEYVAQGVEEAPQDGVTYGRKDGAWVNAVKLYGHTVTWQGIYGTLGSDYIATHISLFIVDERDTAFTEQDLITFLDGLGISNDITSYFAGNGLALYSGLTITVNVATDPSNPTTQDVPYSEQVLGLGIYNDGTANTLVPIVADVLGKDVMNKVFTTVTFEGYIRPILGGG